MKLIKSTLFGLAILLSHASNSQSILAAWTFPTGTTTDSIADIAISANNNKAIRSIGTSVIDFTKNGLTTKSAQTTGWDAGTGTKYWLIELTTLGYNNLHLSSRQQSGGTNPGPRDFKVQYSSDLGLTWIDVPGTNLITANNYTSAFIDSVALPITCNNKTSLSLRWLMNSDTSSTGTIVTSTGISKIDDIYVYGSANSSQVNEISAKEISIFPNPTSNIIYIQAYVNHHEVKVDNSLGSLCISLAYETSINVSELQTGVYSILLYHNKQFVSERKFIKSK